MIRIVGVQRSASPEKEFVLMQNQGSLRMKLRGHVVTSDSCFDQGDMSYGAYALGDDVQVPPGMFVILFTGCGEPRWAKTKEGQLIYYAYMGRSTSVWDVLPGTIHVLATQHSYSERPPALLLR